MNDIQCSYKTNATRYGGYSLTIHYTETFCIKYLIGTIYGKLLHKTPEIVCPNRQSGCYNSGLMLIILWG